jgi:phosphatidylethanolamine-binding protein (PEBP) family uncharacterized protein
MRRAFFLAVACVGLAGCNAGGSAPSANLPMMNVAFNWCSGSPAFTVGNIPATAKTLSFRMIDQQAQSYNHGGGTVPATGKPTQSIPCGALTGSYNGPSPPPPQVHDYQWTVTALDAGGQSVAIGRATRKFPE